MRSYYSDLCSSPHPLSAIASGGGGAHFSLLNSSSLGLAPNPTYFLLLVQKKVCKEKERPGNASPRTEILCRPSHVRPPRISLANAGPLPGQACAHYACSQASGFLHGGHFALSLYLFISSSLHCSHLSTIPSFHHSLRGCEG